LAQGLAQGLAEELPADLRRIIESAHEQVGVTLHYDPGYSVIPFPGGDVPMVRGVCTDVIIRAYRSVGVDLQLLVNQDMRKAFSAYPRNGVCPVPIRTSITGGCLILRCSSPVTDRSCPSRPKRKPTGRVIS
jgi:hypothetical protein